MISPQGEFTQAQEQHREPSAGHHRGAGLFLNHGIPLLRGTETARHELDWFLLITLKLLEDCAGAVLGGVRCDPCGEACITVDEYHGKDNKTATTKE